MGIDSTTGLSPRDRLPRLTGEAFKPRNTKEHTYEITANELRTKALFDFWAFIDLINMHGGCKAFSGELHKSMADFVSTTQTKDTELRSRFGLIPRGHFKSTLGTVAYCLWRIYRNPNIRICVGTATKLLATTFVREVKQYLEDDELQRTVWNNRPHIEGRLVPVLDRVAEDRRKRKRGDEYEDDTEALDKKIVWRSDALQVLRTEIMREPTVVVASVGMSITGMHFDLVILDDVVDRKNTVTPELREKVHSWIRDLESIVDPVRPMKFGKYSEIIGREFIVWGTRYHKQDYYAYLLDNLDRLKYIHMFRSLYTNGENSEDGFIFPERFNEKVAEEIKERQGLIYFASQYLNKIITSEDVVFEISNVQYFHASRVSDTGEVLPGMISITDKDNTRHDIRPIMVIDPAISQKKTADYSVILVGGLDSERNFFCLDIKYGRWLPNELIAQTYEIADQYKLSAVHIEVVGFQAALLSMFKMNFGQHRPISLLEYRPKGDKQGRIKMHLQPLFDNHMIYLSQKLSSCKELQEELTYFPTIHDDLIDAMAMCVELATPAPQKKARLYGQAENPVKSFVINNRYGGRLR